MSTCSVVNKTKTEMKEDMIRGVNFLNDLKKGASSREIFQTLSNLRGLVKTEMVDNSNLKAFRNSRLHLDPSGKTARYVFADDGTLATQYRTTDKNKIEFAQKKGEEEANKLSSYNDNKIKADFGTKIHAVQEYFMHQLIKDYLENTPEEDRLEILFNDTSNESEILNIMTEFQTSQLHDLSNEVSEILDFMIKKQKSINEKKGTKEPLVVLTEQFIFSKAGNTRDIGSTIDLMAIYSDRSVGVWDYKSITPHESKVNEDGVVNDPAWIPFYKLDDIRSQMFTIMDILKNDLGLTIDTVRAVPIQMSFKRDDTKPYGERLSPKIENLFVGSGVSRYLTHISIAYEKFDNEALNNAVEKLAIMKNNLILELKPLPEKSVRAGQLRSRIRDIQEKLNAIQVEKDISTVYEMMFKMFNKYYDLENSVLKDINTEFTVKEIDGTEIRDYNKSYLTISDLNNLITEFEVLKTIMVQSSVFFKSMDFKDPKVKKELEDKIKIQNLNASKIDHIMFLLKENLAERIFTAKDMENIKSDGTMSSISKWLSNTSEQNNTVIRKAYENISLAQDRKRLELQKFEKELKAKHLKLETWGKSNGYKGFDVFNLLVDKKTGNLYKRFTSQFWDTLNGYKASKSDSNKKEILKFYKLREDWKSIYEAKRQVFLLKDDGNDASFQRFFGLESDNVIYNNIGLYYELDYDKIEKDHSQFLTEEYKKILSIQEVKEYYDFYTSSMKKFNAYAETDRPTTFVANIRNSAIEALSGGLFDGLGAIKKNLVRETKEYLFLWNNESQPDSSDNFIDPRTNEVHGTVPRMFINPIYDHNGDVDNTLKSFDLTKSIVLYAEMAINYKEMKKIEDNIQAMKLLALDNDNIIGSVITEKISPTGNEKLRISGEASGVPGYLNHMIDFYVHGEDFLENKNGENNKTEALLRTLSKIDSFNKGAIFTMNIRLALKAWAASRLLVETEAAKSIYFNSNHLSRAYADSMKAMRTGTFNEYNENTNNMYFEQLKFWEIWGDKFTPERLSKLTAGKLADPSMANLMGYGDRAIDNIVLYALLQNYAIKDGILYRINKPGSPDNLISLLDSSKIVDGKLVIEGLIDDKGEVNIEIYNKFRRMAKNVINAQKGTIDKMNTNVANMYGTSRLLMSMKNWIPALAKERLNGIEYNFETSEVTIGRYRTITNEMFGGLFLSKEDNDGNLLNNVTGPAKVFAKRMPHLLINVLLKGSIFAMAHNGIRILNALPYVNVEKDLSKVPFLNMASAVSIERAKALLDDYKSKYPTNEEIQNITIEEFTSYYEGQMKAAALEVSYMVITGLTAALMYSMLKENDDDEEELTPFGEVIQSYGLKTFRGLNRELTFFVNPLDWTDSVTNLTSVVGVIVNILKLFQKTGSQTKDFILEGEIDPNETPFYMSAMEMLPYFNTAADLLDTDISYYK